ncbi:unnamed protein product [Microthlaspi erraticum]|uniref:Uncharacterized protein n=1 Tax=Microthlaspi erraticum TaxID=1685480 RepID=A0A6D2KDE6_9BRAS|nr:unnamed protein product [Microthlaspi erraticum]
MELNPVLRQILPPSLLPINQHHRVANLETNGAKRRGGLENRGATGHEIFDDEASLILLEDSFDGFGGSVVFDLLTAHEHGDVVGDGDDGGDGESGVRDAADDVEGCGRRKGRDESLGDLSEEGRVRDDETEVDVNRRVDSGFELEVAEFHGADVVELENQ